MDGWESNGRLHRITGCHPIAQDWGTHGLYFARRSASLSATGILATLKVPVLDLKMRDNYALGLDETIYDTERDELGS